MSVEIEMDLARRIGELSERLHAAGICGECGGEIFHHMDEPFSTCQGCGITMEDPQPGTIQTLRHEIYQLKTNMNTKLTRLLTVLIGLALALHLLEFILVAWLVISIKRGW